MNPETDAIGNPDEESTAALAERLRKGDADAATLLNELYRQPLLRFCWGYLGSMEEAEDAIQEIWYKVLTAGRIPDSFRPWLYKIARNQALNILRHRAARKDAHELPAPSRVDALLTGQLTRLVKDEMKSRLGELVAALSDAQRETLRLRYVEGLSRAEIAEVLDIPASVVKSRLFEGLKTLKENVAGLEDS